MLVTLFDFGPHETEGRYLVNHINADRNRCKNEDTYFYATKLGIYSYSFEDKKKQVCVFLDEGSDYVIGDYAVYDNLIYYVLTDGEKNELHCSDYITYEDKVLISEEEMNIFNGGNEPKSTDYFGVDAHEGYLFFGVSDGYEYLCPVDGDIKADSIRLFDLFEDDDWSGNIQQIEYDGIVIARYAVDKDKYKIHSIRDEQGYKILYGCVDNCIQVNDATVHFMRNSDTETRQYRMNNESLWKDVSAIREDKYSHSEIYEEFLTAEDEKIIGLLSVSRHWAVYWDLWQRDLEKEVLFELDTETGESNILFETRNNLTKIIGYQDGILYFVKDEKVCKLNLESKEKTELFDLPKGKDYIIDWQAGYLIIREEFTYGQSGDIVMVYEVE